ncbi:MAG: GDP-mannose 4,6-dehydratase [Chloroflexi bacterium]|nr:GDP-mannose 4,6-dehydratase [Chloroflexota bacterium]
MENSKPKIALITGISGQDGFYLSEFLRSKGYLVYGLERRVALEDQKNRDRGVNAIIIPCDITNYSSVFTAVQKVMPDEIYHLAAQSDVGYSFKDPFQTFDTNMNGTLNILEAMRILVPNSKFYFAGSSEMFGDVLETPQTENTPFNPRSPYGVSKVAGFQLCKNYRIAYNLFICNGILFNHESPKRGKEFVTRKITSTIKKIMDGKVNKLKLGNIESKRDWGFSGDYVEAMWLMLQHEIPDDYVVATNEVHTVKEFVDEALKISKIDYLLTDEEKREKYLELDENMIRPSEVNLLMGDYSKIKEKLGWEPKTKFKDLVKLMMENE